MAFELGLEGISTGPRVVRRAQALQPKKLGVQGAGHRAPRGGEVRGLLSQPRGLGRGSQEPVTCGASPGWSWARPYGRHGRAGVLIQPPTLIPLPPQQPDSPPPDSLPSCPGIRPNSSPWPGPALTLRLAEPRRPWGTWGTPPHRVLLHLPGFMPHLALPAGGGGSQEDGGLG